MNKRLTIITCIIFLAAVSRLLPHAPNFTPIAAMALFGGAYINNRFLAFLLPALAMLLSDALMGFNGWYFAGQTIAVYGTFLLITALGLTMQRNKSVLRVGVTSLAASVLFFVVTNFFTWMGGFFHQPELYTLNLSGLLTCYEMAIPFFRNTVAGDLVYSTLLFGGFYLLQINMPALRPETARA